MAGEKPRFVDLYLDIGADDADEARRSSRPAPDRLDAPPLALAGGRVASGALDNRASLFVALEVLRRLAARPRPVGSRSSRACRRRSASVGARACRSAPGPDVALALDVTYATDVPAPTARGRWAPARRRSAIFRGGVNPRLPSLLRTPAAEEAATVAVEVGRAHARPTPTTSSPRARGSRPGSCRCRQAHALPDRDRPALRPRGTIRLLEAFARRLEPGVDEPYTSVGYARVSRAVIVRAVRTPFGRLGGGLAKLEATELGSS